jgi:hypothetical protein
LERTEKRVRDDLLGAGPKTVDELRSIAGRLRIKYQNQLERKIQRAKEKHEVGGDGNSGVGVGGDNSNNNAFVPPVQMQGVMDKATNMAGGFFAKAKSAKFRSSFMDNFNTRGSKTNAGTESEVTTATIVDLPPLNDTPTAAATTEPAATTTTNNVSSGNVSATSSEGDWVGVADIEPATDAITNFSIGDEDEDADLLL